MEIKTNIAKRGKKRVATLQIVIDIAFRKASDSYFPRHSNLTITFNAMAQQYQLFSAYVLIKNRNKSWRIFDYINILLKHCCLHDE